MDLTEDTVERDADANRLTIDDSYRAIADGQRPVVEADPGQSGLDMARALHPDADLVQRSGPRDPIDPPEPATPAAVEVDPAEVKRQFEAMVEAQRVALSQMVTPLLEGLDLLAERVAVLETAAQASASTLRGGTDGWCDPVVALKELEDRLRLAGIRI